MITPGGLHVPGNSHPSASQRLIARLQHDLEMQRLRADHVTAMLAVAVVQAGGSVTITMKELAEIYDINGAKTEDDDAIVWTASLRVLVPAEEKLT